MESKMPELISNPIFYHGDTGIGFGIPKLSHSDLSEAHAVLSDDKTQLLIRYDSNNEYIAIITIEKPEWATQIEQVAETASSPVITIAEIDANGVFSDIWDVRIATTRYA